MTNLTNRRAGILRPLFAAAIACSAAGCAVDSEPMRSPDAPAAWQGRGGPGHVDADWWRAFGDPVLARLVVEALAHNLDVRLAEARVNEVRALSKVEHSEELPSVDIGAAAARADSVNVVTRRPYYATNWQEQFQASYEVDLWGRVHSLGQAADARLAGSQAARDAVALSVAAETASAYVNLRALDERLDIARQTLKSREGALAFARARLARGYASKLELLQAESEFHATAEVLPQLELQIRRREHALQILLGADPAEVPRGAPMSSIIAPAVPDTGVPSDLLHRRPDIAQAEAQVIANDRELAASKARLLPALQITGGFGAVGSTALIGDPFKVWSLGASVLAPVFEGGRLKAQVDVQRSRREQALVGYEKVVLNAFAEVEDQLAAIELLAKQAVELDEQRVSAQEALRVAHDRYRAGYSNYLEELDAQRSLFSVQQRSVELRADLLVAHIDLYRALGGGWRP